jgi:hypothetical protein
MPIKGNPLTFKGGTVLITPITQSLVQVANATAISMVVEKGSISGEVSVSESSTNTGGILLAAGNAKTTIDLTTMVSQTNLSTPFANGTSWTFKKGDFLTANIVSGSLSVVGTFMVTGYDLGIDNDDNLAFDFKLQNHGDLTTETANLVTN